MTTGEMLRVRAAMKPISTVPRALRHHRRHHRRGGQGASPAPDVCAVPAAGVVAEAMVALVLADAVLEKFGGDSRRGDRAATLRGYLAATWSITMSQRRASSWSARRAPASPPSGALLADRLGVGVPRHRRRRRGRRRQAGRRHLRRATARQHFRALERAAVRAALRRARRRAGARRRRGARRGDPGAARPASRSSTCQVGLADAVRRVGLAPARPLLGVNPRSHAAKLHGGAAPDLRAARDRRRCATDGRDAGRGRRRGSPSWRGPRAMTRDQDRASPRRQRPYEVVVGTGVLGELPGLLGTDVAQVARRAPRGLAEIAGPVCGALPAAGLRRCTPIRCPTARRPRPSRSRPGCWSALGQPGFTRSDAVVGVGGGATTDLAGLRRRDLAARRARSCRCRPRCSPWSTRRSAARPASTPPRARTSSARSTRRPACCATSATLDTLPRADYVGRPGRDHQGRLHRRPGDPRAHRGRPGRPPHARRRRTPRELVERAIRGQGRRRLRRPASEAGPARDPQLRPHPRPRHREGRATTGGATARPSPSAWSSPPSWPARRPHRRRPGRAHPEPSSPRWACPPPTAPTPGRSCATMRLDKKTRGDMLRFVVLDGLAKAERLEGPCRGAPRSRLPGGRRGSPFATAAGARQGLARCGAGVAAGLRTTVVVHAAPRNSGDEQQVMRHYGSFVALGDSFTEGSTTPASTATTVAGPTGWPSGGGRRPVLPLRQPRRARQAARPDRQPSRSRSPSR